MLAAVSVALAAMLASCDSMRLFPPRNPNVSRSEAIEIGYAELARREIGARFITDSGMGLERGQWVWELEYLESSGRFVIEIYVCVNNGSVVKLEIDR